MNILTIDGNNLVHRVYWVANNMLKKDENFHVYMFLNSVRSYAEMYNAERVYCVWDEKPDYKPNKRKELLTEYKGTRDTSEKGREVHQKNELIKDILQKMGIPSIYPREYEADDAIAVIDYLFHPHKHIIVTVDKDLCQLVSERTVVYDPIRKIEINLDNFKEILKFPKEQFLRAKAIAGDKSDNIPGIKGFGQKKIEKFFKGEVVFTEDEKQQFEKNVELMTLVDDGPEGDYVYEQIDTCSFDTDWEGFKSQIKELKFTNILKKEMPWYTRFFQTNSLIDLLS